MKEEINLDNWKKKLYKGPYIFPEIQTVITKDMVDLLTYLPICRDGGCYLFPIRSKYPLEVKDYLKHFYKEIESMQKNAEIIESEYIKYYKLV